ncbi:hypothetical protein HanRHA438_Chr06g0276611 [Helianthus annuus]|nr:hypothetical protein HanRHA438_Chr06g0276611 [Helianthus annuus]
MHQVIVKRRLKTFRRNPNNILKNIPSRSAILSLKNIPSSSSSPLLPSIEISTSPMWSSLWVMISFASGS